MTDGEIRASFSKEGSTFHIGNRSVTQEEWFAAFGKIVDAKSNRGVTE